MTADAGKTFTCPSCGQRFAWKPELSGRKVSCRCAAVFEVALDLEGLESVEPVALWDEVLPKTPPPPPPPRIANPQAFYQHPTGRGTDLEPEEGTAFKNVYLPMGLIALGVVLRTAQVILWPPNPAHNTLIAAGLVICEIIVSVAIMFGAVALSAKLLGTTFGSVDTAALKLGAIAIIAGGVADIVASFDDDPYSATGLSMGWGAMILIYWTMFAMLFNLELYETLITVAIVAISQAVAACMFWKA